MPDTVWVLRHGQREDSVDSDWAEHADRIHDPGLTEHGHWQARRAAGRLLNESIEAIYASPFLRAVQTASHVGRAIDVPVRLDPGLGEHLNPEWFDAHPERLPSGELLERFAPVVDDHDPLLEPTFPEGHEDAQRRIGEAARRIVEHVEADHLLLVGHGATVGGVVAGLAGATDGNEAPLAGLTKLGRLGEDWQVIATGDTEHLDVE